MKDETKPGALALVGSGEFTQAMRDTDSVLLNTLGGATKARVVVLPTAAGLEEPSSPERWARMGVEHFEGLGARVQAAMILNRADAEDDDERWRSMLEEADFYYFSGGNPQHVIDTMVDTPAWEIMLRRHLAGAVLAGCSAGAMAFGGWTPHLGGLRAGRVVTLSVALGVVPALVVLPHFDKMGRFIPAGAFNMMLKSAPTGALVVGVDEDTAVLRLSTDLDEDGQSRWQVSGRQSVTLFDRTASRGKRVYHVGETVSLPATI
jgi:cyanophycinase